MEPDRVSLLNAALAGQYAVERVLGTGGMAVVYAARDLKHDRRVALKVLRPELALALGSARFAREIGIAGQLHHPNILPLYESGDAGGLLFYAMPLVEGESLRDRLRREKQLPIDDALRIAGEVADALSYAHSRGVIHRDIKPENILLESGHALLADFGIAKAVSDAGAERLTETGLAVGTPAYMSPEQATASSDIDARSDIYSVGCVLYEMLVGEPPFTGPTPRAVLARQASDPVPSMRTVRDTIPPGVERIVRRSLAKVPADRYATASQMMEAMAAPEALAPAREPRRWHPALITAGLLVVAAGGGAAVVLNAAPAVPFSARDWIVLADFDNRTGDSVFDRSLDVALAIGLAQSRHLNVFPRARVPETLQRMQRPDSGTLGEALAREIAVRQNLRLVVAPAIARIDSTYVLTTQIIDPGTGSILKARSARVATRASVLDALDNLTRKLRRDVGESFVSLSRLDVPLGLATTPSLEALRAWSEGNRHWSAGRYDEAGTLFQRAVQLDSNFAMAHKGLGGYHFWAGNRTLGDSEFNRALRASARVTERERMMIEADVYSWRSNLPAAIPAYRTYLERYPDDLDAWFNIGNTYMQSERPDEAIAAFERVIALDSLNAGAYVNIATSYRIQGRHAEAVPIYRKAFALQPSWLVYNNVNHEYGFTLVMSGDAAGAEATFRSMLTLSAGQRAFGNRSLALMRMYEGRYSDAIPFLDAAVIENRAKRAPISELRDRLHRATVYRMLGDSARWRADLRAANTLAAGDLDPTWLLHAGRHLTRAGMLTVAESILVRTRRLADLNNREDNVALSLLSGEMELARGRTATAIEQFANAVALRPDGLTLESLGRGYLRSGNREAARATYEKLAARPDLGWEAQEGILLAPFELSKLYESLGDTARAIAHLTRFVERWKDGDTPVLADARRHLARLQHR